MLPFLRTLEKPGTELPRVIGKPGTYGFAYWPALLCEGDTVDPKKYISKIFYGNLDAIKQHFDSELTDLNLIEDIDPEHKFTLRHSSGCQRNIKGLNKSVISMYPSLRNLFKHEYVHIINIEYGGIDLNALLYSRKYSIDFNIFICSLRPILEGLFELNEIKGLLHRDLKPSNILMDDRKNTVRFSIIDFGLMCYGKDVFNKDSMTILTYEYPIFPPEFQVIGHMFSLIESENLQDLKGFTKAIVDNQNELVEKAMANIKMPFNEHNFLENIVQSNKTPLMQASDIRDFIIDLYDYVSLIEDHEIKPVEIIQRYVQDRGICCKCDIYSLGYVLLLYHKVEGKITYKSPGDQQFFYDTIVQMMTLNPLKRANAKDIIEHLEVFNICPIKWSASIESESGYGSPGSRSKWVCTPRKANGTPRKSIDRPFSRKSIDRPFSRKSIDTTSKTTDSVKSNIFTVLDDAPI